MNDFFIGSFLGGIIGFCIAMALVSQGVIDAQRNKTAFVGPEALVLSSDAPINIHPLKREEFYLIRDSK